MTLWSLYRESKAVCRRDAINYTPWRVLTAVVKMLRRMERT